MTTQEQSSRSEDVEENLIRFGRVEGVYWCLVVFLRYVGIREKHVLHMNMHLNIYYLFYTYFVNKTTLVDDNMI